MFSVEPEPKRTPSEQGRRYVAYCGASRRLKPEKFCIFGGVGSRPYIESNFRFSNPILLTKTQRDSAVKSRD